MKTLFLFSLLLLVVLGRIHQHKEERFSRKLTSKHQKGKHNKNKSLEDKPADDKAAEAPADGAAPAAAADPKDPVEK